jgi:hypothetical protein
MATAFPAALDSFTAVTSTDSPNINTWNRVQDALAAIEAVVGIDSSAVETSLDYRITDSETTFAALSVPDADVADTLLGSQLKCSMIRIKDYSTDRQMVQMWSVCSGGSFAETTIGYRDSGHTYDGTYFSIDANTLTIKDAAIPGTVSDVMYAWMEGKGDVPHYCDVVGTKSGATIVLTVGGYTGLTGTNIMDEPSGITWIFFVIYTT